MAGKRRLPQEVAEITGAKIKNPQRFKDRFNPDVGELGQPPERFTDEQKELWAEFAADFPWLRRSDRHFLGLAVLLRSRIAAEATPSPSMLAQLRLCLSSMGGTPVDRSKVHKPDGDEDDPANEFVN